MPDKNTEIIIMYTVKCLCILLCALLVRGIASIFCYSVILGAFLVEDDFDGYGMNPAYSHGSIFFCEK